MATTWKKILTEGDTIGGSNLGLQNADRVLITSGNPVELSELEITAGDILGVPSSGGTAPQTVTVTGGDVTGQVDGSGNLILNIGTGKVDNANIADSTIEIGKLANQTDGGIMVYSDLAANGTGVPTFIPIGSAAVGSVLKVSAAGADGGHSFEFAAGDSASTVDLSVDNGAGEHPVLFGGINDTDADTGVSLLKDGAASTFTYNPGVTHSFGSVNNGAGAAAAAAAAVSGATAGLTSAEGITGNLNGTATASIQVGLHASAATDSYLPVTFGGETGGYTSLRSSTGITYNPVDNVLKVDNLMVTGDSVQVNTSELNVEDKTIRVGASDTTVTAANAAGAGIVVNVGVTSTATGDDGDGTNVTNADANLPRVVWGDQALSNTTLGWQVANVGAISEDAGDLAEDANTHLASSAWGVAVMHHDASNATSSADVIANVGGGGSIGVGALYYSAGSGTLWIQTEI